MKSDNQHLDFLMSQYVDGTLDTASRKSVEQQIASDPEARLLFADHRETQDLLDDWGNRIPLIDWDNFDQKLAERLEQETVGSEKPAGWRRWIKPAAIAAGLVLAAVIGYSWNAWWGVKPTNPRFVEGPGQHVEGEVRRVAFKGSAADTQSSGTSVITVKFPEANLVSRGPATSEATPLVVSLPNNAAALQALRDALGLSGLQPDAPNPKSSMVIGVQTRPDSSGGKEDYPLPQ